MTHSLVFDRALQHKPTLENEINPKEEFATIQELEDFDHFHQNTDTNKFNYRFLKHLISKPEKTHAECKHLANQLRYFNFPKFIKESIEGFNEEKLLELVKCLKIERHPPNTALWGDNEYCNARMYLILSGEVTTTKKNEDPISKMIISARPGVKVIPKNDRSLSPKKKHKDPPTLKFHPSFLGSDLVKKIQLDFPKFKLNDNLGSLETLEVNPLTPINPIASSVIPGKYELDLDSCDSSDECLSPKTKRLLFLKKVSLQGRNKEHTSVSRKLPGEFIGEEIILGINKRRTAAYVSAPSELILLKIEDIRHVENIFENRIIDIWNFLKEVLPSIEKLGYSDVKRNIIPYLHERKYDKGVILSEEGEKGNYFYILKEGECQCFKKYVTDYENQKIVEPGLEGMFTVEKKKVEEVSLYTMNRPCIIAEEILFNDDGVYESSVKVALQGAIIYQVDKQKFFSHFPEDIVKGMKKLSKNKRLSNKRLVKEKIHLLEETFPKKQILLSEMTTTQGSENFLSPRYAQTQSTRRKISTRITTNENNNILELQSYNSSQGFPYLATGGSDINTLSEKFRGFSHTKWSSNKSAVRNSSIEPSKSTTGLFREEYQTPATEVKENKENKEIETDTVPKEITAENDKKIFDKVKRNLYETLEKEKFFSDKDKLKKTHTRSFSNNISIPSIIKSPRADLSPQSIYSPKASRQLSLIQNQTEKLIANPKILTTFFNEKQHMESPFVQTIKILPKKQTPLEQLKNYFSESKPSGNKPVITQKTDSVVVQSSQNNSNSSINKTNLFNHSARKLHNTQRRPLRLNVIQGAFC